MAMAIAWLVSMLLAACAGYVLGYIDGANSMRGQLDAIHASLDSAGVPRRRRTE